MFAGSRQGLPSSVQARPRNRSWGLVVLAALLVVGTGLAVLAWGLSAGERAQVLAISSTGSGVAKGQVIGRGDLVSVSVAGIDDAIAVDEIDAVVGKTAAVDLVPGQVIIRSLVTDAPVPGDGEAVVGLALEPNRVPGEGLRPGDEVDVIAIPSSQGAAGGADADGVLDEPLVLTSGALVYAVAGDTVAGGQVLVTVVVDAGDARRVAAYSTQNRVALIEVAPTGSGARE
jgi:hypothetical protein